MTLWFSFQNYSLINPMMTGFAGWANYLYVIGDPSFTQSLINTLIGMAIDLGKRRPVLANFTGGLSGPAVKPIALRMVWAVSRAVKLPIIGIGGIMTATDAIEFILAGATAVQVGTASFINPGAAQKIAEDMETWMLAQGETDIRNLIGALKV